MNGFFEPDERAGAVFSQDRRHRYVLWRVWDAARPRAFVVGLNPSVADETRDDPTMRRLRGLLTENGYGGFTMANLYDRVTPYPRELVDGDLFGPDRHRVLAAEMGKCQAAVAAWGAHPLAEKGALGMMVMLSAHQLEVLCFGVTQSGMPRHPLYLPAGTKLERYEGKHFVTELPLWSSLVMPLLLELYDGAEAHQFLAAPNVALGGKTPLEAGPDETARLLRQVLDGAYL